MDRLVFYPARYGTVFYKDETMGLSLLTMYKTPFEAFLCTVDFSSVVGAGQLAITAITAVDLSTGLDVSNTVTAASPTVVGTGVVFQVQNGTVGLNCLIGVQVNNTSTHEQFEGEVTLVVTQ